MADKLSNDVILEQLKNGIANFELVSSPVPSISIPNSQPCPTSFLEYNSHRFFAKIGPPLGIGSPAMRKVERYSIQRVAGDGRCLFRALVKGMAFNKAISLNPREERENADELRMAVREVICENDKERHQYEEALVAITVEESLKRYCQRIERPDFWGGESELLVLSKLCRQPIVVYIPEHEALIPWLHAHTHCGILDQCRCFQYLCLSPSPSPSPCVCVYTSRGCKKGAVSTFHVLTSSRPIQLQHAKGGRGSGFIPIAEYGAEFGKGLIKERARKAVRLLYSGKNHYDLLV